MGQVIKNVCFFQWLITMVWGLIVGNAAVAQQVAPAPRILTAGDSLLIKELYFKGMQQKSAGQLATAEKTFDKLVLLQPDNDAAHFELARIYIEKEDYAEAERAAKHAAAIKPDNEWYWSMLGDIYKKTGNIKAMPAVFDELIRLHPDKISNYQEKAYVLYLDKQYEASLATYDTVAQRFGETDEQYLTKSQIYLAQNDIDAAIRELEALIDRKPKDAKGYILLAELYTKIKESRKAITLLDDASVLFPNDPLILLGKSDAYLAMNKQKLAYDFLRQAFVSTALDIDAKAGILYTAIANRSHPMAPESLTKLADLLAETYPQEAKAYAVKGDVYMQLQQLEPAQQAYLKALDINRYIESIWQQLLQVELQMRKYNDVEMHGKEALKLFQNHPLLLFFTGHGFLGNRKYQEARTYLESALNAANEEHTPLLTQLYSNLGDTYHALDMHAESDVAYEEAIALDSTNAYALNNYAYYLAMRKEKLPLAAAMSKKSNELMPDYPSYQDTYAWVLFQQAKYDEALEWIQKAIKNAEDVSATLLEHYGDILAKRGDIKGAIAQWEKAMTISESVGKDIDKLSKKIDARQFID
ncbi:tetratricopeptide repeat protein [Parapedobacter indicus]|uniref:Tetratricopeptide repeat-containing protein n=1 Tax=Parapedobacter indicus TaxID=1477437 RepID=A0A1I3MYH8_9SPHI|nr:tetratricopeptide repeat protein [Parapedobacter indicus]PPL00818.1 tetratricopeptide repeat protein [Parapedobacter indicus]SFJ02021.1 Tetratricopeptide repeat-containing protein [Parapedobacter indicus]